MLWFDATFSKFSGFFALDRMARMFVIEVLNKAVNCQSRKHSTMRLCTLKEELCQEQRPLVASKPATPPATGRSVYSERTHRDQLQSQLNVSRQSTR